MVRGVLFDMDGVLVDSEAWICRAGIAMFAELGIAARPEDFLPFVGTGEDRYLGGVAELYGLEKPTAVLKARTYELYAGLVRGRLEPLAGVRSFISLCRGRGLKLAVATSADRIKLEINLREMDLAESTFDATVNGLEVERKKPFPDIFLAAAAKLGLAPADCLVVEDAVSGVRAAKAAGCRALGLTTSFPAAALREAGADWVAADLADAPADAIGW
jgi:HAD superfamily hydrolase (TIGR01509 family)